MQPPRAAQVQCQKNFNRSTSSSNWSLLLPQTSWHRGWCYKDLGDQESISPPLVRVPKRPQTMMKPVSVMVNGWFNVVEARDRGQKCIQAQLVPGRCPPTTHLDVSWKDQCFHVDFPFWTCFMHVHIIFTYFIFNTRNGGFLKAIPTKHDQNGYDHATSTPWEPRQDQLQPGWHITTACFQPVYLTLPNSNPTFDVHSTTYAKDPDFFAAWLQAARWLKAPAVDLHPVVFDHGWQSQEPRGSAVTSLANCTSNYGITDNNYSVFGPA